MMLVLLLTAIAVMVIEGTFYEADVSLTPPALIWIAPDFTVSAVISLALPLFLITMLTQNLPGIAIAKSYDFSVNNHITMTGIGVVNTLLAPFGGFALNYAAITAALCMGEHADDNRHTRYVAAMMAGAGYLIMAALASAVVVLFAIMPAIVMHLLAGLALLATLESALTRALEPKVTRHAALMTFLCSASGLTLASITAPVWGLALGVIVLFFSRLTMHKQSAG